MSETDYPLQLFRFQVDFEPVLPNPGQAGLCKGAFSDCTGLEATMEPKVVKAGGWNFGARQLPGPVSFGTVILKRGMTTSRDLWNWFSKVNEQGGFTFRYNVTIHAAQPGEDLPGKSLTIRLYRALPVKFKCADFNARTSEVSIEELHLAHEGITVE